MKLLSKLAVEAEVIPYFSGWVGGWVAGEVENIAISTQVEVVVDLKLELSLAIIAYLLSGIIPIPTYMIANPTTVSKITILSFYHP